jgi:hypothetical protein
VELEKIVKSILASVQWDVWKFPLSARRLIKPEVVVISHRHLDHWDRNIQRFDMALIPYGIQIPEQFENLKNIISVSDFCKVEKIRFTPIGPTLLASLLQYPVSSLHARWWLSAYRNTRVLFVGDVDARETGIIEAFVSKMFEQDRPLSGLLLPSYGLTETHGEGVAFAIAELAEKLRNTFNVKIGGLPHPIYADWADYNAVRAHSLADICVQPSDFGIQKFQFWDTKL